MVPNTAVFANRSACSSQPAVGSGSDRLTRNALAYRDIRIRRGGRVAEGGGLLNRYTLKRRIKGSNPFLSAIALVRRRPPAGVA